MGFLSSTSGVMTLCCIPLEGSPAAHLLFWQSRRFSFVLYCIFTFHREVKAPKAAAALRGVTMKHKLFSISHVQGHRLGWRAAQALWCLLGCSGGGEKEGRSDASLIFWGAYLSSSFSLSSPQIPSLSAAGEGQPCY